MRKAAVVSKYAFGVLQFGVYEDARGRIVHPAHVNSVEFDVL